MTESGQSPSSDPLAIESNEVPAPRVVAIGGGHMARAIIEGSLHAKVRQPSDWLVVEPDETKRQHFRSLDIQTLESAAQLADALLPHDQILLAVKPQMFDEVAAQLEGLDLHHIVISILAGVTSARIHDALGESSRVIRVMPNLPAQLGEGATSVALGAGARRGDATVALELFHSVGPVVVEVPEDLIDAFTAVAGSGPAYVFYLAQAMVKAARELGFDDQHSDAIVRQTILGAARMLQASAAEPAALRAAVTSKGGTTAAATRVLDEAGVIDTFVRALTAARDRGRKLGSGG